MKKNRAPVVAGAPAGKSQKQLVSCSSHLLAQALLLSNREAGLFSVHFPPKGRHLTRSGSRHLPFRPDDRVGYAASRKHEACARGGHTICWPPERLEVSAPPRARLSNPEIYLSQFAELLRRVFVALRISQTRP